MRLTLALSIRDTTTTVYPPLVPSIGPSIGLSIGVGYLQESKGARLGGCKKKKNSSPSRGISISASMIIRVSLPLSLCPSRLHREANLTQSMMLQQMLRISLYDVLVEGRVSFRTEYLASLWPRCGAGWRSRDRGGSQ